MWKEIKRHLPTVDISIVVGVIFASTSPWWWKYTPRGFVNFATAITPIGFSGGYAPFELYAQNRWIPHGTAIRTAPSPTSREVGSYSPNHLVDVNGWVYGVVTYPKNTPPFNSNVWYHLADNNGWVSFAGVRSQPAINDPTLRANGGPPAPVSSLCEERFNRLAARDRQTIALRKSRSL
jgi:hypothetical protein